MKLKNKLVMIGIGLIFIAVLLVIRSNPDCQDQPFFIKKQISQKDVLYSFFVAGHTYGTLGKHEVGLHSPFKKHFEALKMHPQLKFGIFTGDSVVQSKPIYWDAVDNDVKLLDIPIYFAPGNHDMLDADLFIKRYGKDGKSYWKFDYENDLFIILDPNIDGWRISGQQLDFLKQTLNEANKYHFNKEGYNNGLGKERIKKWSNSFFSKFVVVFYHHLLR